MSGKTRYENLKYWLQLTPDRTLLFGVTEYFKDHKHGIVFIDFVDEYMFLPNDPFGAIEPAQVFLDVFTDIQLPMRGQIVKVNKSVIEDPYSLNENPDQWIFEIKPEGDWRKGLAETVACQKRGLPTHDECEACFLWNKCKRHATNALIEGWIKEIVS